MFLFDRMEKDQGEKRKLVEEKINLQKEFSSLENSVR